MITNALTESTAPMFYSQGLPWSDYIAAERALFASADRIEALERRRCAAALRAAFGLHPLTLEHDVFARCWPYNDQRTVAIRLEHWARAERFRVIFRAERQRLLSLTRGAK